MNIGPIFRKVYRDFFSTAFFSWVILLGIEFFDRGSVHRFINLEYWFYFLLLASLVFLFFPHKS